MTEPIPPAPGRYTEHLPSAARALQRALKAHYPEYTWMVTVPSPPADRTRPPEGST